MMLLCEHATTDLWPSFSRLAAYCLPYRMLHSCCTYISFLAWYWPEAPVTLFRAKPDSRSKCQRWVRRESDWRQTAESAA